MEDEAVKILPQGYVIDYTGKSRQLRKEGSTVILSFALAVVLIFWVLQRQGKGKREAVHAAALTRLRPILMITGATIAGHLPLTLGTSAGAAARNSIGLVLVGGMAIGTLFTLFVIPSVYMLIAREHSRERLTDIIPLQTDCPLPEIRGMRVAPGCRLQADHDCR